MRRILFWIPIGISFLLLASWLVLTASGFRFNPASRRLVKTAYLRIRSEPRQVEVYLNGKLIATKTPVEHKRLLPGSYDLKLEKPGFYTWGKTINLIPSQAILLTEIALFRSAAPVEPASASEASELSSVKKSDDLYFQDGEIFTADFLVTRLSRDVLAVTWYPGKHYVVYQVGREIRTVEIDGSNDFKLVELGSDKPSVFQFSGDGERLIFQDGDKVKKLTLR